jgi:hypothetical protein
MPEHLFDINRKTVLALRVNNNKPLTVRQFGYDPDLIRRIVLLFFFFLGM